MEGRARRDGQQALRRLSATGRNPLGQEEGGLPGRQGPAEGEEEGGDLVARSKYVSFVSGNPPRHLQLFVRNPNIHGLGEGGATALQGRGEGQACQVAEEALGPQAAPEGHLLETPG